MAEREEATEQPAPPEAGATPGPAQLLRATLEKIVFFEWRVRELSAELAGAQSRAAASELARLRAEEVSRAAAVEMQAARLHAAQLESERARLAALLARPLENAAADPAALEAERARASGLAAELADARALIARHHDERERWLNEMIAQARSGEEAPAALAQFISELRGQVIALRDRARRSDAMLAAAGIAPPPPAESQPPPVAVRRPEGAVEAARTLWDEGRLGGASAARELALAAAAATRPETDSIRSVIDSGAFASTDMIESVRPAAREGSAARALTEQCLRGLSAHDPVRRAQAARHLAALPLPAAAPALAAALGTETDARARAALARALAACGGDGAAQLVAQLLAPAEHALVRLAALEALCALGGDRRAAALDAAARDPSPTLRRRAASLAHELAGHDALLAKLAADPDGSVRAAARAAPQPPESDSESDSRTETAPATTKARLDAPVGIRSSDLRKGALHAVRTAIFGLTERELADALSLAEAQGAALAERLVAEGFLVRRGRRLIAGSASESAQERGA